MFEKICMTTLAIVFCLLLLSPPVVSAFTDEDSQPYIGKPAPLFELQALSGDSVALADLKGKFVVIHFAASW